MGGYGMKRSRYTVGEMANLCNVTAKQLRYYDQQGLLKPAYRDRQNGYRYYEDSQIEEVLLFQGTMDLPAPLLSEQALKRHVNSLLAQNTSTEDAISFLGAGCYKRYIPAVCDEIANRSEFLTAWPES